MHINYSELLRYISFSAPPFAQLAPQPSDLQHWYNKINIPQPHTATPPQPITLYRHTSTHPPAPGTVSGTATDKQSLSFLATLSILLSRTTRYLELLVVFMTPQVGLPSVNLISAIP